MNSNRSSGGPLLLFTLALCVMFQPLGVLLVCGLVAAAFPRSVGVMLILVAIRLLFNDTAKNFGWPSTIASVMLAAGTGTYLLTRSAPQRSGASVGQTVRVALTGPLVMLVACAAPIGAVVGVCLLRDSHPTLSMTLLIALLVGCVLCLLVAFGIVVTRGIKRMRGALNAPAIESEFET